MTPGERLAWECGAELVRRLRETVGEIAADKLAAMEVSVKYVPAPHSDLLIALIDLFGRDIVVSALEKAKEEAGRKETR